LSSFRRLAAFFCLAVVLLAALTPSAASLPLGSGLLWACRFWG